MNRKLPGDPFAQIKDLRLIRLSVLGFAVLGIEVSAKDKNAG